MSTHSPSFREIVALNLLEAAALGVLDITTDEEIKLRADEIVAAHEAELKQAFRKTVLAERQFQKILGKPK